MAIVLAFVIGLSLLGISNYWYLFYHGATHGARRTLVIMALTIAVGVCYPEYNHFVSSTGERLSGTTAVSLSWNLIWANSLVSIYKNY